MSLLLVLRPEPGGAETVRRAQAIGLTAVAAPLFRIAPLDWQPPEGDRSTTMMTSANAARHGGPQLARYHGLPLHAVGAATAAAARAAGFVEVVAGVGDAGEGDAGEGDAGALVARLAGAGRVLHLAGREHRDALPPGGVRRAVYAAEPVAALPAAAVAAIGAGAIALLHSARAAATFARLIADAGVTRGAIAIAALSPAVAEAAGTGWREMVVAAAPSDAALLAAAAGLCDQAGDGARREKPDGERG